MPATNASARNSSLLDDGDHKTVFNDIDSNGLGLLSTAPSTQQTTQGGLGCDDEPGTGSSSGGTGGVGDAPAATFASIPTLADYLVNGFWGWSGYQGTGARSWDHNSLSVNIQDLTSAEQAIAIQALSLWHDVCNVSFFFTTGAADITYINDGSGSAVTSYSVSSGDMSNATVHISSDWSGGAASGNYSYFFQTYVHETGHALGLGHQGPYNGSGTYGVDNIYTNDTWRWSVMSYFSQNNYSTDTYDYVLTPEMADIYAVQSIYGAQTTRSGNTTYGFNSTAGSFYNFATYTGTPAFTLYDSGGNDTLDASGYSNNQTIDLTPGNWSSIGGETNNIGIYLTTTIENAVGGSGDDTILGNDAANDLYGNAGADTLKGAGGADYLSGGDGNDTLNGGTENDTLYGGDGDDSLKGAGGADYLSGGVGTDTATYDGQTTAINANLSTGIGQFGDAAGDTYSSVENLYGTSGGDTLIGNSVANVLTGADGNDTIQGFLGSDTMNGGDGTDTLSYDLDRGVTISLAVAGGQNTGGSGVDTVSNFENLTGSYFNDTLSGNDGNNSISGIGGSDTINGLGGDDVISAGSPNTYIVKPQAQNNSTIGTAVSLDSSFVQTYSPIIQNSTITPHATVLATASGNFEYYSFTVGAGANVVFDIDQTIGVDTYLELFGTNGTTLLTTEDDSSVIDPGSATALDSYLSYTFANAGTYYLRVDRFSGGVGPVAGSEYTLNVSVDGHSLANPTTGSTLNGGTGADTIYGSAGNDTFIDSDGVNSDAYYAGSGIDTIDYSSVSFVDGVSINLSAQKLTYLGSSDTLSGFENVEGSQGGETLILGNSQANVLNGNGGNDTIDGFFGNDTLNGGAGTDTVSYTLDLGVTVNLAIAGAQNTGGAGIDTLSGFENLNGGFFNDILTGNAGDNVIRGGGGVDQLNGGAGDDTLYSSYNNATIFKPQAQSNSSVGSAVNLDGHFGLQGCAFIANSTTIPHATVRATASGNFEYYSFSVAAGATATFDIDQTSGVDTYLELFSTDGTTLLTTSDDSVIDPGSDSGFDSNLTYNFAAGGVYYLRVDRFSGGVAPIAGSTYTLSVSLDTAVASTPSGGSTLRGGTGDDTYYVFNGGDKVVEAASAGIDTVRSGITWTLSGNVENLVLTGSDDINGTGNSLANTLTGNVGNNTLNGSSGNDTLLGGSGDDTLIGGAGNDTMDGGGGIDTASYFNAAAGVTVALIAGAQNTGGAGTDTLSNIENITGSNHNDTLTGNTGANILLGLNGADTLVGGAGTDTLSGGGDVDTADYSAAGAAVHVALIAGAQNTGGAGIDTLIGIENLTGSSFDDSLTGNSAANVLRGNDGDDTLSGGSGDDNLVGGNGDDTLAGGAGNDTLNGGAGIDTADYSSAGAAVRVALIAGAQNTIGAGSDTLLGVENITGSNFNDTLTGNAAANILLGLDGNDELIGGAGNDTLTGGAGTDTASYAGAASAVTVALVAGAQNTGGAGTDTLSGIEDLTGSSFNDSLTGNAVANTLDGGDGNDTLSGGFGDDTLLGGNGDDLLVGGFDRDIMTGGAGADVYDFNSSGESGTTAATRDQIVGFAQGADHIDLSTIDADTTTAGNQAFTFIGASAFHGIAGELRQSTGATTLVMGDINGDAVADFQIQLNGSFTLTTGNFVL